MCIALLTGTCTVGCLVDTAENIRFRRITGIGIQHILTILEGYEGVGHPFLGEGIHEVVIINATTEGTVRITVETMVVFLIQDEDDTLVS